jgi:hypothetical protein
MNASAEPTIIKLPLSSYENMQMELAWRITQLLDQYWEIRDILEELKHRLQHDDFSVTIPSFDPLKTFGKYQ